MSSPVATESSPEVLISSLMSSSGVGFGTSGARGLVVDMTDQTCFSYTAAFLQYLEHSGQIAGRSVAIGADLRPSSARIARACMAAVIAAGYEALDCGEISSPALALFGITKSIPTLMITGSHIPDDRNGIKFNTPRGEITKTDEEGIRQQVVRVPSGTFSPDGALLLADIPVTSAPQARDLYLARYREFFGSGFLSGLTLGIYQHSSVLRDDLASLMESLGATVVVLGRSSSFVPVDTEAIRTEDHDLAARWAAEQALDAIVSTDGDSDRPLISDERGIWFRGDVAGILCACFLGIEAVVTPVSSNTALEKSEFFKRTLRTRIGSPYVIAGMKQALLEGAQSVAGYEANGGFLLATSVKREGRELAALPTRDAVIVHLALLGLARERDCTLSTLQQMLPPRFTCSDRIKDLPTSVSLKFISELSPEVSTGGYAGIETLLKDVAGEVQAIDQTDGLRIEFRNTEIVHFRPSGNAPEMRCYTEAASAARAAELNRQALARVRSVCGLGA